MSQRKALLISLVITLVLALSAIGIRAAMVDPPAPSPDPTNAVTAMEPGGAFDEDISDGSGFDDDELEFDDESEDDDDHDDREDDEDEEDDDDDER